MIIDEEDRNAHKIYQKKSRSSAEWIVIIFIAVYAAILISDATKSLIVYAWANYQLQQIAKEISKSTAEYQINARRIDEKREKERKAQLIQQAAENKAKAERIAYDIKFNSNECKFWRDVYANNPDQKGRDKIAQHCP
jgi:hypothetical protein